MQDLQYSSVLHQFLKLEEAFIQILNQQGTGTDEAIANRNYLAGRMHDEISEVKEVEK